MLDATRKSLDSDLRSIFNRQDTTEVERYFQAAYRFRFDGEDVTVRLPSSRSARRLASGIHGNVEVQRV